MDEKKNNKFKNEKKGRQYPPKITQNIDEMAITQQKNQMT